MALEAGDAVLGTGLAGAIAAARKEAYGDKYAVARDAAAVNLEAKAIVEYFTANAEVTVVDVAVGTATASGTVS